MWAVVGIEHRLVVQRNPAEVVSTVLFQPRLNLDLTSALVPTT